MKNVKMIVLSGTPPSTSSIYKYRNAGKFIQGYMSAEGKTKKEIYQWEMKSQWRDKTLNEDIDIDVTYYFPDKRRRDWDNFGKLWMDAGTGIIWVDDSQIINAYVHKKIDKQNSRIELIIKY